MARDWRLPAAYEYTKQLSRSGWAWEFLRRNPLYRAEAESRSDQSATASEGDNDDDPPAWVGRWGLMFRGRR